MLHNLNALLAPALMARLVLLVNHVLAREPEAMARLKPHAGRVLALDLQQLPRLLAAGAPALAFRVTPAGLVEWCEAATLPDLRARLDASNPAALALQALRGIPPALDIEGDAQFAADVDWLSKHLRWDLADDLHRQFGPVLAGELSRVGAGLSAALRAAVQGAGGLADRFRAR